VTVTDLVLVLISGSAVVLTVTYVYDVITSHRAADRGDGPVDQSQRLREWSEWQAKNQR
jgi:hypothetical protein